MPDTHSKINEFFDGVYNEDVQRILLAHTLYDSTIFAKCRHIIKDEYFDDRLRRPVRFILAHFDEYGTVPSHALVDAKAKSEPKVPTMTDIQMTMDERWFLDQMETFCRHRALENIMLESYDKIQHGEYDAINERVKEAVAISLSAFNDFPMIDITDMRLDNIPPRRFLYGRSLIRGMVSCLAGSGGTGKTSIAMALSMSVASGTALLAIDVEDEDNKIHKRGNVMFWNLEDPQDEMRRRIAAETKLRNIDPKQLAGQFFSLSGRDVPLCVAKLDERGNVRRMDVSPIIAKLKEHGISLLVIDPLVNAHAVKEHDNDHMNVVVDQFRIIAHEADCAVLILHHFRKGGTAGDGDAARGAVALHAGCRVMETITTMTAEEAAVLGLEATERRKYVKRQNAKMNLSPSPTEWEWFMFNNVSLNNGDGEYPEGDFIGVLTRWQPIAAMDGTTWEQMSNLIDAINNGIDGEYYSSST